MWFMNKKNLSDEQATALSEQAWAAFREQDLDTALESFQTLAKARPADPRWMNGVGAVSLAREDHADAHRHFQMAAEHDYPGGHYNLGILAYQDGDHDAAANTSKGPPNTIIQAATTTSAAWPSRRVITTPPANTSRKPPRTIALAATSTSAAWPIRTAITTPPSSTSTTQCATIMRRR
nr:tetratricopeptide repeat protein [Xanthomonas arboricola]